MIVKGMHTKRESKRTRQLENWGEVRSGETALCVQLGDAEVDPLDLYIHLVHISLVHIARYTLLAERLIWEKGPKT